MYNFAFIIDHVYFYKYIDLATIVVNKWMGYKYKSFLKIGFEHDHKLWGR